MAPSARKALLIGIETYDDVRFAPLPSCRADVWQLKQVLQHPAIGGFDTVTPLTDLSASDIRQAIVDFLDDAGSGDLALVYFSGHGVRLRHSTGEFFFAAKNTVFDRPADSGVSASFVNDRLEMCPAARKIVIIDACESGGYAVGLRTRDVKGARAAPLQSRGSSSCRHQGQERRPTAARLALPMRLPRRYSLERSSRLSGRARPTATVTAKSRPRTCSTTSASASAARNSNRPRCRSIRPSASARRSLSPR